MQKALFLILFLCVNHLVEAGIFLKEIDPCILQGATWLYSNSTQLTLNVLANRFIQTIAPLNNMPSPEISGTTGILYNRDDSCSSSTVQQHIPLPFYGADAKSTKVPKIALIKKQGGNCSLVEKIRNAEAEGAIGVIVYDTLKDIHAKDRKAGVPPESGLTIPAYYADQSVGAELYHQLEKMAGVPIHKTSANDGTELTIRISVLVSLMPADNVQPVAWEYTLLVVILVLITSILASVAMRKKIQSAIERHHSPNPELLPMGKALLTVTQLNKFPTRIIDSSADQEEREKMNTVLSDEKQRRALKNTTAVSSSDDDKNGSNRKSSMASVIIKIDEPVNSMCAVCLEGFKIGDQLRELPCHHEYHCICIDPWLTSKSAECPLCKFDCSAASKSETTIADPNVFKVTKLLGNLLRPYVRFKEKRIGLTTTQVGQAQPSRQPAIITETEAFEQQQQQQQQQETSLPIEEQQVVYVVATIENGKNDEPTANAASCASS